jgi:hypothetical protein
LNEWAGPDDPARLARGGPIQAAAASENKNALIVSPLSRDQLQAQNPEHAREAEDVIPAHRAREL